MRIAKNWTLYSYKPKLYHKEYLPDLLLYSTYLFTQT